MQAATLKKRRTGQVPPVFKQGNRVFGLAHSLQEDRSLQVDVGASGPSDRLGGIEELLCRLESPEPLLQLGQVDDRLQRVRICGSRGFERLPRLIQSPEPEQCLPEPAE